MGVLHLLNSAFGECGYCMYILLRLGLGPGHGLHNKLYKNNYKNLAKIPHFYKVCYFIMEIDDS